MKRSRCYVLLVGILLMMSMIGCSGNQTNIQERAQSEEIETLEAEQAETEQTEETQLQTEEVETEASRTEEMQTEDEDYFTLVCQMSAGSIVDAELLSEEERKALFYAEEISEEVALRINGCSYKENENISLDELSYVRVLHVGFDGRTHIGELIVNDKISEDIVDIMQSLYAAEYPIEKIVLVDEYGGDDDLSMEANNTSAFNYRTIQGTDRLSNHSYGLAIDINPLYNPYVTTASDGSISCDLAGGANFVDREKSFPYKIDHEDLCYKLFIAHGFTWGGDWNSKKDYQHFEKQ